MSHLGAGLEDGEKGAAGWLPAVGEQISRDASHMSGTEATLEGDPSSKGRSDRLRGGWPGIGPFPGCINTVCVSHLCNREYVSQA